VVGRGWVWAVLRRARWVVDVGVRDRCGCLRKMGKGRIKGATDRVRDLEEG